MLSDTLAQELVASNLALAAATRIGSAVPPSQDLSNQTIRAINLEVWETFRAFNFAVNQTIGDPTDWPVPQQQTLPAPKLPPALVSFLQTAAVQALVAANPGVAAAIASLTAAPKAPTLPNPGTPATPTASPVPATATAAVPVAARA